jgi:hypothetical protein
MCNIKLNGREITEFENTEPGHIAKNEVEIWALGEQAMCKAICGDEIGVKEWTRCTFARKSENKNKQRKSCHFLTDCMQECESRTVL